MISSTSERKSQVYMRSNVRAFDGNNKKRKENFFFLMREFHELLVYFFFYLSGLLFAVPVPKMYENKDAAEAIKVAVAECEKMGIRGREVTPFILDKVRDMTAGSSVASSKYRQLV